MEPLQPGSRVADRYRTVRLLSQRALAAVWQCADTMADERAVAVKVYTQGRAVDSFVIDMMREEFGTTAIKHPHILMPTEIGLDRGVPYLVMPLVPGGSYADALQRSAGRPVLDERAALATLVSLSSAIAYLHRKNYVHQDVAASNVLMGEGGSALLGDFGMNRILHNSLGHASKPGFLYHAAYASPERAGGQSANATDDVFSLAVFIYEVVTGTLPWNGRGGQALLEGAAPLDEAETLSDAFLAMLRRCTDPDADSRPTISEIERWAAVYKPQPTAARSAVTQREADEAHSRMESLMKAREAADRAAKEAADRAAKEAADRAAKEAADRAAKEAADRAAKEAADHAAKQAADRAAKEAADRAAKEAADRAAKEAADRAAKEAADRAAKKAAAARRREREEEAKKAREEEARRKREEAERKARADADRAVRMEAERRLLDEIARKAREEAERTARLEAERLARKEEERRARQEADRKKRERADRAAREITERRQREEAERQKREEAERQKREEAERQKREEAERQKREEAERQKREEAERQKREEAERQKREAAERIAAEQDLALHDVEVLDREDFERKIHDEAERKARHLLEQAIALHPEHTMAREEIMQRIRDEVERRVREEFGQQKPQEEEQESDTVEIRKDVELSRFLDSLTSEMGELVPTVLPVAPVSSAAADRPTAAASHSAEAGSKPQTPRKTIVRTTAPADDTASADRTRPRGSSRSRGSFATPLRVILPLIVLAAAVAWYLFSDTGEAALAARIRIHAPAFRDTTLLQELITGWFGGRGASDVSITRRGDQVVFQAHFPDDSIRMVEVSTGIAVTGLAALGRNDRDIVFSARPCSREEMNALGSPAAWKGETALALQGLAVVVGPDHPLTSMSAGDVIHLVTTGTPARGGSARTVLVLPPPAGETDDMLRALLPAGGTIASTARRATTVAEFRDLCLGTPHAIGIIALPVPDNLRALRISDGQGDAVAADEDALRESAYPLASALYAYTHAGGEAPDVVDLVRYLRSDAATAVLARHGLVPPDVQLLPGSARRVPVPALRRLVDGAQRVNAVLRLRTGSTEFDAYSQRVLSSLVTFLEGRAVDLTVIGFSDRLGGSSDDLVSTTLAEKVANELRAHGIEPTTVRGAGSAVMVADDDRPGGRERNRRVEIWVRWKNDSPTSR